MATKVKFDVGRGKIKILGISSSKRASWDCARADPLSFELLKIALEEAEKAGAETKLIDLRELKIHPCKECYSTCPAQCRFNEKTNQCDCYLFKEDHIFIDEKTPMPLDKAYDILPKEEFLQKLNDEGWHAERDDMWKVYEAMRWADGIIFATFTEFYGRPSLFQNMFSRLTALDGGVEELWGDGKNLKNSIKYARNPKNKYKQRLFGKHVAFINCSKEGDLVTPNLMKACTMMGMKIIPFSVAYSVNWYADPTFLSDTSNTLKDKYTLELVRFLGKKIVEECKKSSRKYGIYSSIV